MAKAELNLSKLSVKSVILFIATILVGVLIGGGIGLTIAPNEQGDVVIESEYSIELAEEQVPAIIETEDGEIEIISAPTVDMIDSQQVIDEEALEELDLGQGAWYDISSPEAYKNATLGKCIDMDGKYGAQCVDLSSNFAYEYTGRWWSTCGTGAAYGLWDCRDQNAGVEYELITDTHSLQAGDWVIFGGGQYGHVGMALGGYNNGYIALLGQNQGGGSCNGGGAAVNIINMSLTTFRGAFRPKMYVKPVAPEPKPELPISNCTKWHVAKGDTMGKIMLECENTVVYGEAMNDYAKTWYSLIMKPGQSVYEGWTTGTGYGLYYDDDIEHRTE